jgi:serine/threonine protein kinase
MPLTPGTRLGPYQVIGSIGAGGMGEVSRAHDTKLRRDVALKIVPPAFTSDPERMGRFEREAHVLASLSHPNIASIFGIEESGATRALVMELVEGPTLADRIDAGPIPVDESIAIAREIAEALEAAHEKGIVHRDLKPANLKVTPDGVVKLLDFGLAKAFSDRVETTAGDPANSPTLTLGATVDRDGRFLLYRYAGPKTSELWALPLVGDRKPIPLVQSEFSNNQGQLSPDGRWLAYTSNEAGRFEIYVVPFAPGSTKGVTGKWQVSTAGGSQPRWRGDGRELFYLAPDRKLMAVEVKATAQSFERGTPQALYESRNDIQAGGATNWGYIPTTDGRRFLTITASGERNDQAPLTVVVNWLAGVKK